MAQLVKLNVIGLTYSQTQSAAYALVLGEENGSRRIPIVIGSSEAQAIAMQLQGLTPTRPLTHDLFVSLMEYYALRLVNVTIYKMEKDVFYSELFFQDAANNSVRIDSRTSDAVALAVRTNSPIFTTEEIMKQTSVLFEEDQEDMDDNTEIEQKVDLSLKLDTLETMSVDDLNEELGLAIDDEDYEKAQQIKDELKRRQEK